MLFSMYALAVPVFGFLAWIFSEAVHFGTVDDRRSRALTSMLAGALWPVMLVGVAQMLGVWSLARLSQARRLEPASGRHVSDR